MCAAHHRIWLQVAQVLPVMTIQCTPTLCTNMSRFQSHKVLVFSEGRQHGSRQKPLASVANYPCVLFITEYDSKFAQVLPVMTIQCTPTLCTNMSRFQSHKVLVFSEGRQHGSRQKPVASVANYPCVLFITEYDSKLHKFYQSWQSNAHQHCAQTCQEIKSQKGLVFSEGRQHGSRQKPVASVANYPCVLFITEHDSMFAQVLPVMTIPCTPTLCININMSRN